MPYTPTVGLVPITDAQFNSDFVTAAGSLPGWYWPVAAAVFGAVFASFGAVCVERLAARLSLGGRSRCVCGRVLRASENVPLWGWLRSAGLARCCGARIPAWYVLFEGGCAALFAAATWWAGPVAVPVCALALVAGCVTVGVSRRR